MNAWMTAFCATAVALPLAGSVAYADGGMTVQLPDVSGLSESDSKALIAELATVNVITANCADYEITNGEWTLITGTGDQLAAKLGLDPAEYDRQYYGPAFKLLDDPASCDKIGPTAAPLIKRLVGMGGGTTPLTQSQ